MKKNIALVTGGYTGEYVVSLKSAEGVERNLDASKYSVYKIIISKLGWQYTCKEGKVYEVNRHDFSLKLPNETVKFDTAFICLHGSPGEDGKLQGYFDMLDISYTSCNAITSAITMNKAYTKAILAGINNLYLAKSVQLFTNTEADVEQITSNLQLPYFVKTNHGGSSIGMSKIKLLEELPEGLQRAFKEDHQVLVEEFIEGREFSIGVYCDESGIQVLPATEVIPTKEFFDFESKYSDGLAQEITPGRMSEEEKERVAGIVKQIYQKLDCKGVVRIDYFLQKDSGNFYFIEINTIPGQTEHSFIPMQVKAAGKVMPDFYSGLLEATLNSKAAAALPLI